MKTGVQDKKKLFLALAALVVAAAALLFVYRATRGTPKDGTKTVAVEVFHKDGATNSFSFETERVNLRELLTDAGLAEGEEGPYGLFITTVDGETADEANQEWWCITKEGEKLNTAADTTLLSDGDHYELTLTVGY